MRNSTTDRSARDRLVGGFGFLAAAFYPLFKLLHLMYEFGGRAVGRRRFKRCGVGVRFFALDSQISFNQISVGNNVFIGHRAYLSGPSEIGNDVMFGPEVQLMGGYHRTDLVGSRIVDSGGDERQTIFVEDDVWLGSRATVMKGVRIGEGAVVATESLVLDDVPPYTIVAGSPARVRKFRFTDDELRRHILQLGGSEERARQLIDRRTRESGSLDTDSRGQ